MGKGLQVLAFKCLVPLNYFFYTLNFLLSIVNPHLLPKAEIVLTGQGGLDLNRLCWLILTANLTGLRDTKETGDTHFLVAVEAFPKTAKRGETHPEPG